MLKPNAIGARIEEGSISSGTLRPQDLLIAFAAELERLARGNGLTSDARACAAALGADEVRFKGIAIDDASAALIEDLMNRLDTIASIDGMVFCAHADDGACFGYWRTEG